VVLLKGPGRSTGCGPTPSGTGSGEEAKEKQDVGASFLRQVLGEAAKHRRERDHSGGVHTPGPADDQLELRWRFTSTAFAFQPSHDVASSHSESTIRVFELVVSCKKNLNQLDDESALLHQVKELFSTGLQRQALVEHGFWQLQAFDLGNGSSRASLLLFDSHTSTPVSRHVGCFEGADSSEERHESLREQQEKSLTAFRRFETVSGSCNNELDLGLLPALCRHYLADDPVEEVIFKKDSDPARPRTFLTVGQSWTPLLLFYVRETTLVFADFDPAELLKAAFRTELVARLASAEWSWRSCSSAEVDGALGLPLHVEVNAAIESTVRHLVHERRCSPSELDALLRPHFRAGAADRSCCGMEEVTTSPTKNYKLASDEEAVQFLNSSLCLEGWTPSFGEHNGPGRRNIEAAPGGSSSLRSIASKRQKMKNICTEEHDEDNVPSFPSLSTAASLTSTSSTTSSASFGTAGNEQIQIVTEQRPRGHDDLHQGVLDEYQEQTFRNCFLRLVAALRNSKAVVYRHVNLVDDAAALCRDFDFGHLNFSNVLQYVPCNNGEPWRQARECLEEYRFGSPGTSGTSRYFVESYSRSPHGGLSRIFTDWRKYLDWREGGIGDEELDYAAEQEREQDFNADCVISLF